MVEPRLYLQAFAIALLLGNRSAIAADFSPPSMPFVFSLAQDATGKIWVGTEDKGVFRYDPAAKNAAQWTNFTTKNGLGDDNAYAICPDNLGRIWVGHLNHGVSVYNGESWKNYDVLDGPIGERVFSIAADPKSGDIWIATSAGLTRYSVDHDKWSYITRADGLPSDQVQSLAFDARGNVYAGTQCDGLAIGRPPLPRLFGEGRPAVSLSNGGEGAPSWTQITGSDSAPLTPTGAGLPGNLINQMLVSRSGTIYAATTCGLAASKDGKHWMFIRGADWAAKVKGLYGGAPRGWRETRTDFILAEDYCTCLAEDDSGLLWIGHWRAGYEVIDPQRLQRAYQSTREEAGEPPAEKKAKGAKPTPAGYTYAILLRCSAGAPLVGWYGHGLTESASDLPGRAPARQSAGIPKAAPVGEFGTKDFGVISNTAKHPSPAAPPTLAELNEQLHALGKIEPRQSRPEVCSLEDDWRTQGDWIGRYGRFWNCLCAIISPQNYYDGAGCPLVKFNEMIGPNGVGDDAIRYWVHWLYTDNPRVLEMPLGYFQTRLEAGLTGPKARRRQAEVDDHGEDYATTRDGPHLFFTVWVPAGNYRLSMYFYNKDGHEDVNRNRDYVIRIRPGRFSPAIYGDTATGPDLAAFNEAPLLASARVRDFWGGVYKRFHVEGPSWYSIQVDRNGSHNTICSSVMLDLPDELPPPYFWPDNDWGRTMRKTLADRERVGGLPRGFTAEDMERRLFDERAAREALRDEFQQRRAQFLSRFAPADDADDAADRAFEELQWLPLRSSTRWEAIRRSCALPLCRQYLARLVPAADYATAKPRVVERLEASYHDVGLFDRWEEAIHRRARPTVRDMEFNANAKN